MTHTNHMEPGPVEKEDMLQKRLKEDTTFRKVTPGQEETSQKNAREGSTFREDKLQTRLQEEAVSQGTCSVQEDQLQKRLREEAAQRDASSSRKLSSYHSVAEITQIRPYLLLCGATALRGSTLADLGVTAVVNATQELPDTPLPAEDILYLRVDVGDRADTDILGWMDIVADLIHQVRMAGGKTLIHCVAGVSRSAALCLAYLVKCEHLSLLDAYQQLKALRHIVRPNAGFFGQLVEFERRVSGRQTVAMVYSDLAHSCIPHLYEDDYRRRGLRLCSRV